MSFPRSPRSQCIAQSAMLLLLACSVIGLSACRSDRVSVNAKDPNSPQYSYRLDELALLQMAADDIQEMERRKQYGQIYDEYGSDGFKKNVSRRRFLIMSNCVETYLGGIEEINPNELGFRRKFVGSKNAQSFLDVLNRNVLRIQGNIEEQLVFVPNGLNFKLNGLYWIAKDKQFLQCIADSPKVEADTAPKPETPETATEPATETQGEPAKPTGETPAQPTAPEGSAEQAPNSKPQQEAAPQSKPPTPGPVQEMNPSEIKKQPLEARPAGAGAVIDERPTPKKRKTPEAGKTAPTPSDSQEPSPPSSNQPPIPQQEDD